MNGCIACDRLLFQSPCPVKHCCVFISWCDVDDWRCFVSPGKQARIFRLGLQFAYSLHLMFLNVPSWTSRLKFTFLPLLLKTPQTKKNSWALCVCCWSRPPQQFSKVSSFWFIKAIFQLDWDAYLSPLRGACWVYSAADLLEV